MSSVLKTEALKAVAFGSTDGEDPKSYVFNVRNEGEDDEGEADEEEEKTMALIANANASKQQKKKKKKKTGKSA
jgi:hypothetical protein